MVAFVGGVIEEKVCGKRTPAFHNITRLGIKYTKLLFLKQFIHVKQPISVLFFLSRCVLFIQFHAAPSVPAKPLGHSGGSSQQWADAHECDRDALFS